MQNKPRNWEDFALILIDVQKDFWTDEMTIAFPDYEKNVARLLAYCRDEKLDVIHLRARFLKEKRDWIEKYKLLDRIP